MLQVREHSVAFPENQLGIGLVPGTSSKVPYGVSPDNIAVVGSVTGLPQGSVFESIRVGDAISKINGIPVAGSTFKEVIERIRTLSRPLIIHFIQIVGGLPTPPVSPQVTGTVTPSKGSEKKNEVCPAQ